MDGFCRYPIDYLCGLSTIHSISQDQRLPNSDRPVFSGRDIHHGEILGVISLHLGISGLLAGIDHPHHYCLSARDQGCIGKDQSVELHPGEKEFIPGYIGHHSDQQGRLSDVRKKNGCYHCL